MIARSLSLSVIKMIMHNICEYFSLCSDSLLMLPFQELLKSSCAVNVQDTNGREPLHVAASEGHSDLVLELWRMQKHELRHLFRECSTNLKKQINKIFTVLHVAITLVGFPSLGCFFHSCVIEHF